MTQHGDGLDVAPLYDDHLVEFEVVTESESYLAEYGYTVDTIRHWLVVSDKDDEANGYVVTKAETTDKPLELADLVADATTIWLCSCPAYRYRDGVADLGGRIDLEWTACKHCEAVEKSLKAANDNAQTTL